MKKIFLFVSIIGCMSSSMIFVGCKKDSSTVSSLVIQSLSVSSGREGQSVTITGKGFSAIPIDNIVEFNGKKAAVASLSYNSLITTVPPGAGTGPITVTVNGISATGPVFTYLLTGSVGSFVGNVTPGFINGSVDNARFNRPTGIATDAAGNIYVADNGNNAIRKITPDGTVSTVAGSGTAGYKNGTVANATFSCPEAVAVDNQDNIYISDFCNHVVRKISTAGQVSTLAGSGIGGYADGVASSARFDGIIGIAVDNTNAVYVADYNDNRIRKISGGIVSTLAGTGVAGYHDGSGTIAQFFAPHGLAIDLSGNIIVADEQNNCIRSITPGGAVSTIAGLVSSSPYLRDGPANQAEFAEPDAVGVDPTGNIFIGDALNGFVREITNGQVSTLHMFVFITSGEPWPDGIATDTHGNVYVSDSDNNQIYKVTFE